ncbi:hypothetical protein HYV83_00075 [Candidatus Woesearchaeota archaeon]|nr:hypothetical protein [Candidatus Woesearchaeota archaeon]
MVDDAKAMLEKNLGELVTIVIEQKSLTGLLQPIRGLGYSVTARSEIERAEKMYVYMVFGEGSCSVEQQKGGIIITVAAGRESYIVGPKPSNNSGLANDIESLEAKLKK